MPNLARAQHYFRELLAKYQAESVYRLPVILAIALHVLIFAILFLHFDSPEEQQITVQPDVDIIKAVAVSPQQLTQLAEAKAEKQRQEQEALEQQKRQQEAAARAKADALKQQQEQARQQALKAAQEAAKLAAQQKALEQQKALQAQQEAQKAAAAKAAATKAAADKAVADKAAADKAAVVKQSAEKAAETKKQQDLAAQQKAAQQKKAAQLKAAQDKETQEQIAAEQRDLQAARSKLQQSEIEKYKALIEQAISQNWEVPTGSNMDLTCELMIQVGPGGTVLNVQVSRSSGDPALDSSARAAVFKASPLPVPKDPDLFNQFRQIRLTVKPEDVQNQ